MSEAPPNHPTDEELRALSLGQLVEAELARVSAHLAECPACCRRIDELAAADPLVERLQQSAASRDEVLVGRAQRRSAVRALRQVDGAGAVTRVRGAEPAPVVIPVPRQVGDYDILAEVGRGGMGVVYRAQHRGLHRPTALKMVLAGEFASPAQELRFRLEAELAARVRHPNFVQVYEIGRHEGRPFLAMEWVEGGSLEDRLDGKPWSPGEAAALVETLARAIHAAHAEGVVHRDLKPANILLAVGSGQWAVGSEDKDKTALGSEDKDSSASSLPTLIPKITDFGLAQPTEGGQTLTQSGFLVGTPGYMAPEQAAGKRALVGPATDVYALGVVLYQLLTGRLPFQADSALEVLRAVASDEPTRPRRLQPRLPRDLEAVTLHCLEKEPARRYPSALALAEDLERFRTGRQVVARPVGAAARLVRACRRYPLVALLFVLLTASLLGGVGGVTWKWLEADKQRDQANAYAQKADAEKREARFQSYRAHISAAASALAVHDVADAARHLEAAPEELRGWEWRHLQSRLDDSSSTISLPAGGVGFLLAGPDRLRIGVLTSDGLRLTDVESGETSIVPIGPERRRHVTAMPTRRGLRIAAWVGNTAFDLLDEKGQALCRVEIPDAKGPEHVAVSPDGTRLACGWHNGQRWWITVFDATSGKQTAVCDIHSGIIRSLTFSPDGTRLASGSEDRTARLWDPATGALLAKCQGHASKVLSVAFRPEPPSGFAEKVPSARPEGASSAKRPGFGSRLVTTSSDGTVRQWNAATGQEVEAAYDHHSGEVTAAVYSPDGQWVASTGTDRTIRVWRASDRRDVAILHGHTRGVVDVAFAPDGRRLVSLSRESWIVPAGDDTVRVWDVDPEATLPVLRGHSRSIYPVAFSPDGRWIASGSWDTKVRLWDAATGKRCATLPHSGIVRDLAYAPDGSWLVSGTDADNRLRIWDVATARIRKEIPLPAGTVPGTVPRSVSVSPDGKRVAATAIIHPQSNTPHLYVCDVATDEQLFTAEGWSRGYSPDGRWLAITAANERTILLLNARTHETVAEFPGHKEFVFRVAFSPDGRRFASCSADRTIRLWEIDSGACQELRGHTTEVFAVAFHPDGTRLASADRDGAVWLWDLTRGEDVARLTGHTSFVWSLAFSPDGATLVSGSGDTTVRLWDTTPLKARYQTRHQVEAAQPAAVRLVDRLFAELGEPSRIVVRLQEDASLDDTLRRAALQELMRRSDKE